MVAYNCCAPLLPVLPTGGGKSAVQDTSVLLLAGVTITSSLPLLSLGTNQTNNATLEFGLVTVFLLNEIKDPAMQQNLLEKLVLLPSCDTTKTIL
jgi:superfamily II DNA helicase RecQ